jgi:NIMA (never in mitosis gene a)-related kinase
MNLPGFVEEKVLGKGTYGQVYKARRLTDGVSYAVKVVNLSTLNHREIEDSVNEIRLMASFTSPFIIRFYESFCDNKRLCIVTEYSRLGDLAHLLDRRKRQRRPLQEEDIWRFFIQMLEGLRVLHSHGVVHRDLKSANILLSAPDFIKIADLGVSTVLHATELARTQIGTPIYIAPEIWRNRPYDQMCDMWSLGVLLYEMMTFTYPFYGANDDQLSRRICIGYYPTPRGYSADLVTMVRMLLQTNPLLRPTAEDLLKMEAITSRHHLIDQFLTEKPQEPKPEEPLLSTIHVPGNLGQVKLPRPSYGKKPNVVKPLEQRIHIKNGAFGKRPLQNLSSPELRLVCDRDWWSPLRFPDKEPVDKEEPELAPEEGGQGHKWPPAPPARVITPHEQLQLPGGRKHPMVAINPRFKRMNHG